MQIIWEKLYYRIQTLFIFLQARMIRKNLGLANDPPYRIDLLRTLQTIKGTVGTSDALIDIGANKGEFAQLFSHLYKPAVLICIEPNDQLNTDIRANNPSTIIINKAVSDTQSEQDFYFHVDSQMSSLFPSDRDLIKRDFGEDDADSVTKKTIPVTTLDTIFSEYAGQLEGKTLFLKIDTQGNELEVIKGGRNTLEKVSYCLLEYMFHTPYTKQYPFESIISVMSDRGFKCAGPMHSSYRAKGEIGAVLFLFSKNN